MKLFRSLKLAALLALAAVPACASEQGLEVGEEETGASTDSVTTVDASTVKRQSIGNCWIYATVGWVESLHKTATGTELNLSESYVSYWHWFEQIANGEIRKGEISTGGFWGVAADLMIRYGVMQEADFIPEEANAEMSMRQKSALTAINASIKSGALSTPAARRDRALVRRELDRAWGLQDSVRSQLDRVFGASVSRTLDRRASTAGTAVKAPKDIPVALRDAQSHTLRQATLTDMLGRRSSFYSPNRRTGALAWNEASYGWSESSRRETIRRVQRALHDRQPVILSWFVDFNALDSQGRFFAPPTTPGRQGGHMTVMYDYQVENVPGYGTLAVGETVSEPEKLSAALSDEADVTLFRVKNSWGSFRPDREFVIPGYHDLYLKYLNGPVKQCQEDESGSPRLETCYDATPIWGFLLPPGY